MAADAFYELDGDRFISTQNTVGPWSPAEQHGGPPSALVARALERCEPREGFRIARVTIELLRAVPIEPLTIATRVARPGRSVELLEATMSTAEHDVMAARAWRFRTSPSQPTSQEQPPPGPEHGRAPAFFWADHPGYARSMEWLLVGGEFNEPGPASAWMRMRIPLLAGEEPTPLQRVMIAADSGNGVSAVLHPKDWIFVNTDLTVNLFRDAQGEHVNIDAVTRVSDDGVGQTETKLWDARGRIGHATQSLLVRARG